ncbi:MAG: AAA family ATPase [Prevotella sp.]|jgi:AAA+ ATPase superfamily predicted ATPase
MAQKIIGRKREKELLEEIYNSGNPEFVVVHGRRRVGKTFLIRELFSDRLTFYHTGLSPVENGDGTKTILQRQLETFYASLSRYGYHGAMPSNWIEALNCLIHLLEQKGGERQVVFLDELPWIDTAKSGFMTAFEHFWNGWGAGRSNLMLVVCGSSTSWINDNIINNHGGLYNRITAEIALQPFTLKECEDFYIDRGIMMDRYDMLQSYMIFGGVPYYMSLMRKGLSLAQNIDELCFSKRGQLRYEFDRLFNSLFVNPEANKSLVRLLFKRKAGMKRNEIISESNKISGGGLTNILKGLEAGNFITTYRNYGASKREIFYKLTDFFCLFYLNFMDEKTTDEHYWSSNLLTGSLNAWRGLAFENLCFAHVEQLKTALGIAGVHTETMPWRSKNQEDGAQIDMLIDRDDRVINVCEMKFATDDYVITRNYDRELRHKLTLFSEETKTRKSLHLTLVTTYGLKQNEYSGKVQRIITMNELFT